MEKPNLTTNKTEQGASPEKEAIIEKARDGRFLVLSNYYERLAVIVESKVPESVRKGALTAANFTFVADFKMAIEGFRGKTFAGRELSSASRLIYLTTVFLSVAGKALGAYGAMKDSKELMALGAKSYVGSYIPYAFVVVTESWDTIKTAVKEKNLDKVSQIMGWFESIPENLKKNAKDLYDTYGPKEKNA